MSKEKLSQQQQEILAREAAKQAEKTQLANKTRITQPYSGKKP